MTPARGIRTLWTAALLAGLAACGRAPAPSAEARGEGSAAAQAPAIEVGNPERGREIYLRGVSPSGAELTAEVGVRGGAVVPAASLPCVNCHGRDGRGKPEAGVTPSNVRWESLTRPYEVQEASGRAHPPYDDRLAGRAITMGVDSAGTRLDDAMPRYRLARADLADLLAYLKKLSTERDPGLGDTEIRIGTLIPEDGPLAPSGAAVLALLTAFFADLDERGGIYGRRVELVHAAIPASGEGPGRTREVERFLDRSRPFALTAVLLGGEDQPIATLLDSREVPVIGAITLRARPASPPPRSLFHLYGGLAEQATALALFAARAPASQQPPAPNPLLRLSIIRQAGEEHSAILRRIAATLGRPPSSEILLDSAAEGVADKAALFADLARDKPNALLFLGPTPVPAALLRDSPPGPDLPLLLVPGALAGDDLFTAPPALAARLRVAFPVLPSDRTPEGMSEYTRLAERHHLPADHLSAQLSALVAAKVLVEALTRAGREATRERLLDSTESLRDYPTGLTPPLTYGKNRHTGLTGAHIVTIDPRTHRFTPTGPWLAPD